LLPYLAAYRRHRAANEGNRPVKFQPKDAYVPEMPPLSPTREALKSLNEARAEAAAEVTALRARTNKLAKLKESVAALEIELSQTLAADGRQLEDWAMSDADSPAPQPDSTKRLALEAKLADAVSQARAADAATASVESVLDRANQRAADLERSVPALVANVLVDEARALLPAITEATEALSKAKWRFTAARDYLLNRAEASRDAAMRSGFFQQLEALDIEARKAGENAMPLDFNATVEWREMAAALGDTPAFRHRRRSLHSPVCPK
jgi:hypothetical protein